MRPARSTVIHLAVLSVVALVVTACGGGGGSAPDGSAQRPSVCGDMDVVATVWTAQAPADMLGDAEALGGFTGGLLEVLNGALTRIVAVAPDDVAADAAAVEVALENYYATARAYAAGDTQSVPMLTDDDRAALGRVAEWASTQCPGERW
jgi:hypothetical protein